MHDELASDRRRLQERIAKLLTEHEEIQKKLSQRIDDIRKCSFFQDLSTVELVSDDLTTAQLYERRDHTYIEVRRWLASAEGCFALGTALYSDAAQLQEDFSKEISKPLDKGVTPDIVAEMCTRAKIYLRRLSSLLVKEDPSLYVTPI